MSAEKKPFKETKFYKFVTEKLAPVAGDVTGIAGKVVSGQWGEALGDVSELLNKRKTESAEMQRLALDFEREKLNFSLELNKLEIEAFRIEQLDKVDARATEIERMRNKGKNFTHNILAMFGVAAFFGLVFYVVSKGLHDMNQDEAFIVGTLIGGVSAIAQNIYQYYFGTSRSSNEKQNAINEFLKKK